MTWLVYLTSLAAIAVTVPVVASVQARLDGTARRYNLKDRRC